MDDIELAEILETAEKEIGKLKTLLQEELFSRIKTNKQIIMNKRK